MKMKKLTYLFAICPAVVALASCNKAVTTAGNLPGSNLPPAEAIEYVKTNFAYDKGYLAKLSKTADVAVSTSGIALDGILTIPKELSGKRLPAIPPTHINFSLPIQENMTFNLNNNNGASGAIFVAGFLSYLDNPTPSNEFSRFNRRTLLATLPSLFAFNPFLTSSTVATLDKVVTTINDTGIIEQRYSVDDKDGSFYVSLAINDLGKLTKFVDEQQTNAVLPAGIGRLLNLIRGKDGNLSFSLGFDKFGFMSSFNFDLHSNLMSLNYLQTPGDKPVLYALYYGKADVDISAKFNHHFYAEEESYEITFTDASITPSVNFEGPKIEHLKRALNVDGSQSILGLNPTEHRQILSYLYSDTSSEEAKFMFDAAAKYYDYLLPGYGTDFVIIPKNNQMFDEATIVDMIKIRIAGFDYPLSTFNRNYSKIRSSLSISPSADNLPLLEVASITNELGKTYVYVALYPEFYDAVGSKIEVVVTVPSIN